jgi:hypothetical protein
MTRSASILTTIGVVAAVVIAWVLVSVVFQIVWFVAKLIIVGLVAVLVYFALRGLLTRGSA